MDSPRSRPRLRRWSSVLLAAGMAVTLALGLIATWMQVTVYNADGMAARSVHVLDSGAVRHELALQLTDQLVKSGNRQIIAFRPAAQLTVETIVETDAFKSLFATAIRKTHSALLSGDGNAGLDLSDTLGFLAAGLQLNQAKTAAADGAVATTTGGGIAATVTKVADLPFWGWRDVLAEVALGLLVVALLCAIGSVWVAFNRRLGVVRVGLASVVAGVLVAGLTVIGAWIAQRFAGDPSLRAAIHDAVWAATADLRATAVAVAVMGAVVAAAASPTERFSPEHLQHTVRAVYDRMRGSTGGTLALALLVGFAGLIIISNPEGAVSALVFLLGLSLVFVATRLLISLASTVSAPSPSQPNGRRWLGWGIAVVSVASVAVVFGVLSVHTARAKAEGSYVRSCLGSESRCDLRLDQVTLAGAHNAMSSPAYPGWLFAEQLESIRGQLDNGVRALLIDAHYGRTSSVRVPGSNVNLVVTDIASEFTVPGAELPDPALKQRAEELAASAPGGGAREVFLCHNYCELGAVKMVDEMTSVRRFLEANPGEIVMIIVQDAVSVADVQKVFAAAGLLDHVATLRKGEPLPTLGDLVDADTRLVVFAERGEDDAPDWYPRAYDWFQETGYTFDRIESFNCLANRGDADRPLFLVNHWVGRSPPDPALAKRANAAAVLDARIRTCLDQRDLRPNVIAADFATTGDVVSTASRLTDGG